MDPLSHINPDDLPVHKPDPGLWDRIEADMDCAGLVESAGPMPQHAAPGWTWGIISMKLFLLKYGWLMLGIPAVTGAAGLLIYLLALNREPAPSAQSTPLKNTEIVKERGSAVPPLTENKAEKETPEVFSPGPSATATETSPGMGSSGESLGSAGGRTPLPAAAGHKQPASVTSPGWETRKTAAGKIQEEPLPGNTLEEATAARADRIPRPAYLPSLGNIILEYDRDIRSLAGAPPGTARQSGSGCQLNLKTGVRHQSLKESLTLGAGLTLYNITGNKGLALSEPHSLSQYEIFVNYKYNHWLLQTGIAYSGFSDTLACLAAVRTDRVFSYEYVDSVFFGPSGQIISYFTHTVSFHDSVEGSESVKATVNHSLISLPLLVGKYWRFNKLSLAVKAGMVFTYLSSHSKKVYLPSDPSVAVVGLKELNATVPRTHMALDLSAEAAWRFAGHFGIALEPTLRYYTKPLTGNNTQDKPRPLLYGIKTALFYEF